LKFKQINKKPSKTLKNLAETWQKPGKKSKTPPWGDV